MLVEVGKIVNTFGLKGELKLLPTTNYESRFEKGSQLCINDKWYKVERSRYQKNVVVLKLESLNHINDVEVLKGSTVTAEMMIEEDCSEEGMFHYSQLLGVEVYTEEGDLIGKLDEILEMPADDIFKVGEVLIPARKEFVKDINIPEGKIVVKLLEGMM